MSTFPGFATNAVHAGQEPEQWNSRAVVPPIFMSSTYIQEEPDKRSEYFYSRKNNPTRECVEKCIAALEGGKYGIVFASGIAALHSITMLLEAGDHVVRMDDVYGGTSNFLRQYATRMGIKVSIADFNDTDSVENTVQPQTRLVWMETPTNPSLQIIDLDLMVTLLRKIAPNCITVVDNTFSSPYFQRPLDYGVDIVMYSVTKYMNGHADVVMGAVVTNDDQIAEKLHLIQSACGPVPSPFDCFLVNRGLKTLHLRMKEHMKNGLAVAMFLEGNPRVEKVLHPGLPSHPQHDLAKKQMKGYSGMVTFYIKGGLKEAKTFLKSLKVRLETKPSTNTNTGLGANLSYYGLAFSLGGYESLSELPTTMTHVSVPREEKEKVGITDNMIRLSVGLEDEDDLIQDLDNALKIAVP